MEGAWAQAVAAGIEDGLFWACTPPETERLLSEKRKVEKARARAADLRAALVASEVRNMSGRRARTTVKPSDYLRHEAGEADALRAALIEWALKTNGRVRLS